MKILATGEKFLLEYDCFDMQFQLSVKCVLEMTTTRNTIFEILLIGIKCEWRGSEKRCE